MPSEVYEIKHGTKLHTKVLDALCDRKKLSERKMADRHKKWEKAEEHAVAYVKETEADALRREKKDSAGVISYTTLEVPYSYGMMMSAHTYMSSVFLARDPVLQYAARHGESQQQVLAVEALMGYQNTVGEHNTPYYIWLYDALNYGCGVIMEDWAEETLLTSKLEKVEVDEYGLPLAKPKQKKTTTEIKGYQGHRLHNVKPFDWLPDPRVPMSRFQDGEFCGHKFDMPWNDVVEGGHKGVYYNLDAMKHNMAMKDRDRERGTPVTIKPDPSLDDFMQTSMDLGYLEGMMMTVRLIPKDWGIGSLDRPEKWNFIVGNEKVILAAMPQSEYHGKFNYSILEQEIEGYKLFKQGMMEQMKPMNDVVTWLFNSHFYNVRAALNNQFIYDPSMVVQKDMMQQGDTPGLRVRLKPDAYGRDVRTVVGQLPVADVTRGHLQDLGEVGQLMQRSYGVVDNVMGMLQPGGRKTATEVRTSSSFGVNRLKTQAEYMSSMGFAPHSMKMLQTTQQYYDQEQVYKVAGSLMTDVPGVEKGFMKVTPETIQGFFDFIPVDGTLPVDRFAQANLWKEIMIGLRNMPEVAAQYDVGGMFQWLGQLSGMRNIAQFKLNLNDPEVLESEKQKGNLVAVNEAAKQGQTGPTPPAVPGGQIPNIGPTA